VGVDNRAVAGLTQGQLLVLIDAAWAIAQFGNLGPLGCKFSRQQVLDAANSALAAIDHLKVQVWDTPPDADPLAEVRAVPTVSGVVLELIQDRGEINLAEIMDALKNAGNVATQESVSSILSRMVSAGLVGKGTHRGTWVRIPESPNG
jgi:hypothetical protein